MDPSIHSYNEPEQLPPDIYPYAAVHDEEQGIMGSCSTYYTRRDITNEVRTFGFEQAWNTFGNKLVFVASQQLRTKFLVMTKRQYLPTLNREVTLHAYCILERIGRCRNYGCLDITKEGIKLAPKEIFYHRRKILRSKWITRQFISKKKKKGIMRYSLYYLHRYHVEHKSELTNIMQNILESLKAASATNYILPINSFSTAFGTITSLSVKKLVIFFQMDNVIKEFDSPYSKVYPTLSKTQCLNSLKKEKIAQCVQLLDPNINIEKELNKDFEDADDDGSDDEEEKDAVDELEEEEMNEYQTQLSLAESFTLVEPVSDLSDNESSSSPAPNSTDRNDSASSEEDFVEESLQVSCLQKKGFLIEKELPVDLSIKKQLLKMVEESGPEGCPGFEIKKRLQLNRIDNRNLQKHCVYLDSYLKDEGRQRRQYFRLKRYKTSSHEHDIIPCKNIKLEKQSTANSEDENDEAMNYSDLHSDDLTEARERRRSLSKICVSDLQFHRANDILEYINEKKYGVFYQIYNYILSQDKSRHQTSKCDRKTVRTLLDKLAAYKCLKIVDISMKIGLVYQEEKTIRVFAQSDLDTDNKSFRDELRAEQSKLSNLSNDQFLELPQTEFVNCEIDLNITDPMKTETSSNENEKKDLSLHQEGDSVQVKLKSFENMIVEIRSIKRKSPQNSIINLNQLYPTQIMNDRVSDCYQCILQNRIVVGSKPIQRFVSEGDKSRNYNVVIDHRTIRRMMEKMSLNNHINCFLVKFKNLENDTEKELYISTVLDVTLDDSELTDILEKEKLLFIGQHKSQSQPGIHKPPKQSGEYTILSKFGKMEKMHKLAFHVAYSEAKPLEDQELARSNLERHFHVELPSDHPPIYDDSDLNDFTFLPSLSPPNSYPRGFICFNHFFPLIPMKTLMESMGRDCLSESLDQYYRDPVRRFYPIKDTDAGVYTVLTRQSMGRKNVSSIYNIFQNLATIGLTQFGKRNGIEKENFLLYVNQKTSLRDTINAAPSYIELDPKTMKPATLYHFHCMSDVKKYWLDTSHICTNTPLGIRTFALGQKITTYKRACDKPILAETCKHIDDMEIVLSRDNGEVPGDGLGAGGFDSHLYAHMKKNWFSGAKTVKTPTVLKPTREVNKLRKMLSKGKTKIAKKPKVLITERTIEKKSKKTKSNFFFKRTVTEAARRNFRSQIKWNAADADVLHLTHILYKLFKVKPCNRLTRDILVKMFNKKVLNKKSKSLNTISSKVLLSHYRRVLKIPENRDRFSVLEAEVNHRSEVRSFLNSHITDHRELCCTSNNKTEAHRYICDHFLPIVKTVYEMIVLDQQSLNNNFPSSYDHFLEEYRTVGSIETLTDIYPVPNTKTDMELNILLNLIYSSLASGSYMKNDKMSIILFDAYQRYSEPLIHRAIKTLRKLQVIASCRYLNNLKHQVTCSQKSQPSTTSLPLSRFKFSLRYLLRINPSEMKCSAFYESFILFKEMSESPDYVHDITHVDGTYFNILLTLLEYDIKLDIETPETLLLFDPNVVTVHKHVVDRYNELVEEYKQGIPMKRVLGNEEDEDEEKEDLMTPMNLFNAARLAMYNLRDVLIRDHISVQHVHKLLTLNTCKILLSQVPPLVSEYDGSKKEAYIRKISERITVPQLTQQQITTLVTSGIEKELEQFIENKKHLGATSEDIRLKFGASRKVKDAVDLLVDKHVIIETGTVLVTYVHNKSCTPWLLKISANSNGKALREITIKPWIHVDGVVNRMVLDYMLCLVLNYIMFNPGLSLLSLQEHFATVLQPVHIIQLIEILLHFQCILAQALTVVAPTLFTEGSVKMSPATLLEPSHLIHIEAVADAVLKMGGFIDTKSYDEDFLCDIVNNKSEYAADDVDQDQTNVEDGYDGSQELLRLMKPTT